MGFQRNTIDDTEHKERSLALIEKGIKSRGDMLEMFFLYNDRLTPRENGMGCGTCRAKVWKRLKQMYGL